MIILLFLLYSVLANASNYDFSNNGYMANNAGVSNVKDIPKQTNYITKDIDTCPDVGYFFRREMGRPSHPGACLLCFCTAHGEAVCWPRDNMRCDVEHYHHHGVGKRDTRHRRSPEGTGFSDIFFRDAVRDLFDKRIPETCKPFQDSFSDGCPPADWCIGCTVCDCDANGRWNCHTLSFCPEKESKKKKFNSHRGPYKKKIYRRKPRPSANAITEQSAKGNAKSTSMVTRTAKGVNVNKASPTAASKIRTQTKKLKMKAAKRSSEVKKNQTVKMSPKIIKRPFNKKLPQLVKELTTKRSKKNVLTRKIQQVKSSVPRSPQIRKKPIPKKNPREAKVTKKGSEIKNGNQVPSASRSTQTGKENQPQKRNPQKAEIPIRLKKTPLSRKGTDSKTFTTDLPQTTIQRLQGHPDINSALGQEMVKTFIHTFQKIINKNLEKRVQKRTTDGIIRIESNSESNESEGRRQRKKREVIGLDSMIVSNELKNHKRVVGTGGVSSIIGYSDKGASTEVSQDLPNITTNYPTLGNTSAFNYFKYSIQTDKTAYFSIEHFNETESSSDKITHRNGVKETETRITNETILNPIGTEITLDPIYEITRNETAVTTRRNDMVMTTDFVNDLKFKKWFRVEALKDKEQHLSIPLHKKALETNKLNDINLTIPFIEKLRTPNVTRKIVSTAEKKYKLKKNVFTPSTDIDKFEKVNMNSETKQNIEKNKNNCNRNNFHFFVKHILNKLKKNNSSKKPEEKRFKVIRYLQKIFKNMLYKSSFVKKQSKPALNKSSVVRVLCESFGLCHVSQKNTIELHSKLKELSAETNLMLKSIKTIKGLLKLVDLAKNDKDLKNDSVNTEKSNFNSDVQKLNAILKGSYMDREKLDKLTDTQLIQIEYIKRNTQTFIDSTSRFAKVLNEIIDLLSKDQGESKHSWKRILSLFKNKKYNKKEKLKSESFARMKDLLMKYNVVHNNFFEKMYKVISNFQTAPVKPSTILLSSKKFYDQDYYDKQFQGSSNKYYDNEYTRKINRNSTATIQLYTNNIIQNLKKLKSLAHTLVSRNRWKRDLRYDDSMEYFLMLIENLLKRYYPLHITPVNDGIDELLEAIKQAPDIKTIGKKVLMNGTIKTRNERQFQGDQNNVFSEDSTLYFNRFSKEHNGTSKHEDDKFKLINESSDNESEVNDKVLLIRKFDVKSTNKTDFMADIDDITTTTETVLDETTRGLIPLDISTNVYTFEYVRDNTNKPLKLEKTASNEENENGRIIDIYNADTEDDVGTSTTTEFDTNIRESMISTRIPTTNVELQTDQKNESFNDTKTDYDVKGINTKNESFNNNTVQKYVNWIGESLEDKMVFEANDTELVKSKSSEKLKTSLDVAMKSKDKYEERKEKELMYKKELNLLNSLDYGVEKMESDESSIDETSEDKYASKPY